jgi:medium-chain acyl-[acyl-carrier-protein] hydrolase
MAAIVDALVPALLPHMDRPFAFFGHSMGSVVAYEVARDLVRRGAPTPEHLFVSGRRPPSMVAPDPPMHVLPDREFVAEINRRYGGIPDAILRDPELMALFLPCLRADVTALETHQYQPSEPLHCPVSALGGAHDRLTPYEHLDAWRAETTAAFSVRAFPGDHFYLVQQRDSLLAHIAAALAPSLRPDNLMQNA